MSMLGRDVIDVGSKQIGRRYVLGAQVPLNNPNWIGPWDCAEFTSWCTYQAYGMIFGAGRPKNISHAEPYSGHWYSEAKRNGIVIPWEDAIEIPGAVLIRAPAPGRIGHVAFAMGDGDSTLEAKGAAFGVGIFKKAKSRAWSIGCLLPGVEYETAMVTPHSGPSNGVTPLPSGFLWLRRPRFKGESVIALQRALQRQDIDPGPIDGEFGPMTNSAVVSFQVVAGLEVDSVVGPETAAALGLSFPIAPTLEDARLYREARTPKGPSIVDLPQATASFDGIAAITQRGNTFTAKTGSGFSFTIGTTTSYTDDMNRVGLFQGTTAIKDSLKFGIYRGGDFSTLGQWAHFIEPTLTAEGGARFATLNTYDRAAFTFGAPQFAAHTPGENFIVYLRRILALPEADRHFPELSLRRNGDGKVTVHLEKDSVFHDLERVVLVTRPNGKKEKQLAYLMAYLNPSPVAIDAAELSVAARLMNWLRLEPETKELQITVFIDQAKVKLDQAKAKIPGFTGKDWQIALWILDILHQGRGTYNDMSRALASGDARRGLKQIGWLKYKTRIQTVDAAVGKLVATGVLNGFEV